MNNVHRGTAVALALTLLGACAGGSDSKSSTATVAPPAADGSGTPALTGGGSTAANAPSGGDPGVNLPATALDTDARQLVIRMTVGVEVTDVATAVDDVIALAERHGGQLYDSSLDLHDKGRGGGDLVFKLPPDEAEPFITDLGTALGRRTSLQGSTDDVTGQLTDLDARITTARASVERVRALLQGATQLGDVITLEGELTTRQTRLEELLGQQADLRSRVAMATVTVTLSPAPPVTAGDHRDGLGDAFRKGGEAFVTVLLALCLFLGYTAPFLAIGLVVLLVVTWRVSRRRQRPTRSRSAAPPPPPAPDADLRTSEPGSADVARTR